MPTKKPKRTVSPKAKTTKKTIKTKKAASQPDVTVRMFCQGLGDCFLITIPQNGARPYSILIDFGVALGTPSADVIMRQAAAKIAQLTQGVIDLVVLTHEHWDHVSGFVLAAKELKAQLKFKHLWVAWTEKHGDPLADALRKEFAKAKLALARAFQAATTLRGVDETNVRRLEALEGVLAFGGPAAAKKKTANNAQGGGTVSDAMALPHELVKEKTTPSAVDYLRPGTCLALPGATGHAGAVTAFVLGPPYDRTKLAQMNPSEKKDEAYEKKKGDAPGIGINWTWMASAMSDTVAPATFAGDRAEAANLERSLPFDRSLRMSLAAADRNASFASYFSRAADHRWRRIDGDWLVSGAQRLSLKMDNYTNNTCLALALELPASKQVLLFPADAQAGNWRSWHDQQYETPDKRTLSAADLLAQTVLYKVGHHGSHNATLKAKGLELMTHPDLVAMLPVEADGVTRLRYGQMPLKSLVKALREKTDGRILRLDEKWTNDKAPGTWKKKGTSASLSSEQITVGPPGKRSKRRLYMQLVMQDA
jgi:hypothetical protein